MKRELCPPSSHVNYKIFKFLSVWRFLIEVKIDKKRPKFIPTIYSKKKMKYFAIFKKQLDIFLGENM